MDNGACPPEAGAWRLVGAVVQGTQHAKQGLPCQDALAYRLLPDGALLAALADGAGTAAKAEAGAQCAVQAALSAMVEGLEQGQPDGDSPREDLLRLAFERARQELEQLAVQEGEPLNAYAATLLCFIACTDAIAVGQLGDGAVIAGKEGHGFAAVTQAQRGEYLNETYFLTQDDALLHLVITSIEQPIDRLAAMSDGLTRLALKMPDQEPHLPFFAPLFDFAGKVEDEAQAKEQLAQFLASERVCARTDDDKTLLLAVRVLQSAGQEPAVESASEPETAQPGQAVAQPPLEGAA